MIESELTEKVQKTCRIAIIGGGLGGLAVAVSLQKVNIHCLVFERDSKLNDRKQGFGLTLINNPKGPLAQLGLLDKCIACDTASNCHWLFRPNGEILGYYGRLFKKRKRTIEISDTNDSRGNLRIPREDFRCMLLNKLSPNTVQWGKQLKLIEEREDDVLCQFEDGTTVLSDVVIGADGIRSMVRNARDYFMRCRYNSPSLKNISFDNMLNDSQMQLGKTSINNELNYIGITAIIGISNTEHPLLNQQGFYVLDGIHRVFTMPFRPKSRGDSDDKFLPALTMWQLSFSGCDEQTARVLKSSSETDIIHEALRRTKDWFSPMQDIIKGTIPGEIWATPLYDRPDMIQWKKGSGSRITVIGDACHPMSMFKGQGANQAIDDGPLLASWLTNPPAKKDKVVISNVFNRDILFTRLRCFEREMIARTSPKVKASRVAANTLHSNEIEKQVFGIEGYTDNATSNTEEVLKYLKDQDITAHLAENLDKKILEAIVKFQTQS